MSRRSFDELVGVVGPAINRLPVRREDGPPRSQDLVRRKYSTRDVLSMTLKYLTTKSEIKDLHVQFGAVHTSYVANVELGMNAITHSLF